MRKLWAGLFMSLDGVVESPNRWVFPYLQTGVLSLTYSRSQT